MSAVCVISSAIMSVLDGLWWPVFFVLCVMMVMSFVIEECVLQFIVCRCEAGSVVFVFAGMWWLILTGEGWGELGRFYLRWALLYCRVEGAW